MVSDEKVVCAHFADSSAKALPMASLPTSVLPSRRITTASGRYMAVSAGASFLLKPSAYWSRNALISLMAVRSGTLGDSMPWALATEDATKASAATSRKFNRVRGLRVMRASGLGGAKQVVLPRNWRKAAKEQQTGKQDVLRYGWGPRGAMPATHSQLPGSATTLANLVRASSTAGRSRGSHPPHSRR